MNKYYRPLRDDLTIRESSINGLGLFSTDWIPSGENLGTTHIRHDDYPDGLIRTPLGGFFNHSEDPNCKLIESGSELQLVTIKPIPANTELTCKYTLYDPTK